MRNYNMVGEPDNFDSSRLSYQEWIDFFFNRTVIEDVALSTNEFTNGYTFFDVSDPAGIISHLTRMCREFSILADRFSLPQIDQGIWVIFGPTFEYQRCLFDRSVPVSMRVECIRSMYQVYADFVAPSDVEAMENCFYMWWDLIGESFWSEFYDYSQLHDPSAPLDELLSNGEENRYVLDKLDEDSWQILDAIFETLVRILALDDARARQAALHGLGHSHHPHVKAVVQGFIDAHRGELTDEALEWVERCRDGTMM